MALQGTSPYYLHRGLTGSIGPTGLGSNPTYRPSPNPNLPTHSDPNVRSSNSVGPGFNVEGSNVDHGFSITAASAGASLSEPVKKKRGRPRKYGPDGPGSGHRPASGPGNVALGLSPTMDSSTGEKRKKGRPPGTGRKQRLASVGEWMNRSAGEAFTPHVIHVAPGEDIAAKILSFSQQRPRAVCIMSGSGGVSAVTLRQPASSTGTVSFEGRFEILCLSGSYLIDESGGSRNRTGGVNVSLSSPDGHVIGGTVGGQLMASKPVQVVVCTFIYGSAKGKGNEPTSREGKYPDQLISDRMPTQEMNGGSQNVGGSWLDSKGSHHKNPNIDIDLASG